VNFIFGINSTKLSDSIYHCNRNIVIKNNWNFRILLVFIINEYVQVYLNRMNFCCIKDDFMRFKALIVKK
jgi:hypothetical protein